MRGGARRVWRDAQVGRVGGGFTVTLDGRPVRLPDGATLVVSTRPLADAIREEWQSRPTGETIEPREIPLTRLAGTAQVKIARAPGPVIQALGAYGSTDLLCYRARRPEALVRRQEMLWQPWLDWAKEELGAALRVTNGVMPMVQDERPLWRLRDAVAASNVAVLAALSEVVPALGSLVLGLALVRRRIGAADAAAAAFADEIFQAERWGDDARAAARRAEITQELAAAERFVALAEE